LIYKVQLIDLIIYEINYRIYKLNMEKML